MATIELTKDNLDSLIESSKILFIDFWAEWCGPCRVFGPVFEAASEKHEDIVFAKVNTEEQQQVAGAFNVSAIPTLVAFRDEIGIYNQAGALPAAAFEKLIAKVRGLDMDQVRKALQEAKGSKP